MRILLDTHTFLWWLSDDSRLSSRVRELMGDGANDLYLSAASGQEIAVKARLGRLSLPKNAEGFIADQIGLNSNNSLPVSMSHALHTHSLPMLHRDPFDRMLVSQCQLEKMPILSADAQIAAYEVEVVWD